MSRRDLKATENLNESVNKCRLFLNRNQTLCLSIYLLLLPVNMSDAWQECMDHCVEVTKKAGKVSKYVVAVTLYFF